LNKSVRGVNQPTNIGVLYGTLNKSIRGVNQPTHIGVLHGTLNKSIRGVNQPTNIGALHACSSELNITTSEYVYIELVIFKY